jgi:hypothetical protein
MEAGGRLPAANGSSRQRIHEISGDRRFHRSPQPSPPQGSPQTSPVLSPALTPSMSPTMSPYMSPRANADIVPNKKFSGKSYYFPVGGTAAPKKGSPQQQKAVPTGPFPNSPCLSGPWSSGSPQVKHIPAGLVRHERLAVAGDHFERLSSLFRHGKYEEAEQFLDSTGIPVDFQDIRGSTLLHISCQNGNKRLVKLCLRRGAGMDLQNHQGQTALHFAFAFGFSDLGEYLISKGADATIRNNDCLTCYEGLGAGELADL